MGLWKAKHSHLGRAGYIDDELIVQYIDLARAKSEALDNVFSLLKQNIKSCNAKRRRPENGEKQQ